MSTDASASIYSEEDVDIDVGTDDPRGEAWTRVRQVAKDLSYFLVGGDTCLGNTADGMTSFELASLVVKSALSPGAGDARLAPELEMKKKPLCPTPHVPMPPSKPKTVVLATHRCLRIAGKEKFARSCLAGLEDVERGAVEQAYAEEQQEVEQLIAARRMPQKAVEDVQQVGRTKSLLGSLGMPDDFLSASTRGKEVRSFMERNEHYAPTRPEAVPVEDREAVRIMRVANMIMRREKAVNEQRKKLVARRQQINEKTKAQIELTHLTRKQNTTNRVKRAQRLSQRQMSERYKSYEEVAGGLNRFFRAVEDGDMRLFTRHLQVMGDLEIVIKSHDKFGRTPLHFAAYHNATHVLWYCMQHITCEGRDLTQNGYSIYHYAVLGGHMEAVMTMTRSLLKRGRKAVLTALYSVTREGLRAYNIAENMEYGNIRHFLNKLERKYPDRHIQEGQQDVQEADYLMKDALGKMEKEMQDDRIAKQAVQDRRLREREVREESARAKQMEVAHMLTMMSRLDAESKKKEAMRNAARELLKRRKVEEMKRIAGCSRNKRLQREGEAAENVDMEVEDYLSMERERRDINNAATRCERKRSVVAIQHIPQITRRAEDIRLQEACDMSYKRGCLIATQKYGITIEEKDRRSSAEAKGMAVMISSLGEVAASSGLLEGDVILMLNGLAITSAGEFFGIIGTLRHELTLYISRMEATGGEASFVSEVFKEIVIPADRTCLKRSYGLSVTDGQNVPNFGHVQYNLLLVLEATKAAAKSGMMPGDVITHVDGVAVTTAAELDIALNNAEEVAVLSVQRDKCEMVITVAPEEAFVDEKGVYPTRFGEVAFAQGTHPPNRPAAPPTRRVLSSRVVTSIGKTGMHAHGVFQKAVSVLGGYSQCRGRRVSGCHTLALNSAGEGVSRVVKILFNNSVGCTRKVSISGLRFYGLGGRVVSQYELQTVARTEALAKNQTVTGNLPLSLVARFPCGVVLTGFALRTSPGDVDCDPASCIVSHSRILPDPLATDPTIRNPAWSTPQTIKLALTHSRATWCDTIRLRPTADSTEPL